MISPMLHLIAMGGPPQPSGNPGRDMIGTMFPLVIMVVIFYLVLIRPQQKQAKELRQKLEALKVGDRVVTTGGIFGIISQLKEKSVVVKIAENTKVEMLRSGVQEVMPGDQKEEKKP